MAGALRSGAVEVFPGVANGQGDGTLEVDNTGSAFSMSVGKKSGGSAGDSARLRAHSPVDQAEPVDMQDRKIKNLAGGSKEIMGEGDVAQSSDDRKQQIKILQDDIDELYFDIEARFGYSRQDLDHDFVRIIEDFKKAHDYYDEHCEQVQGLNNKFKMRMNVFREDKIPVLSSLIMGLDELGQFLIEPGDNKTGFPVNNEEYSSELSEERKEKLHLIEIDKMFNVFLEFSSDLDFLRSVMHDVEQLVLKGNDEDDISLNYPCIDNELSMLASQKSCLSTQYRLLENYAAVEFRVDQLKSFLGNKDEMVSHIAWLDRKSNNELVCIIINVLSEGVVANIKEENSYLAQEIHDRLETVSDVLDKPPMLNDGSMKFESALEDAYKKLSNPVKSRGQFDYSHVLEQVKKEREGLKLVSENKMLEYQRELDDVLSEKGRAVRNMAGMLDVLKRLPRIIDESGSLKKNNLQQSIPFSGKTARLLGSSAGDVQLEAIIPETVQTSLLGFRLCFDNIRESIPSLYADFSCDRFDKSHLAKSAEKYEEIALGLSEQASSFSVIFKYGVDFIRRLVKENGCMREIISILEKNEIAKELVEKIDECLDEKEVFQPALGWLANKSVDDLHEINNALSGMTTVRLDSHKTDSQSQ